MNIAAGAPRCTVLVQFGDLHLWGTAMRLVTIGALVALAGLQAGCASRASSVAPVAISASDYNGMSCEDSRAALAASQQKEWALSRKQNNAATADAAAVFLFALPLGSVFGADVEGELAQAKGESLALRRYTTKACVAQPVVAAPAQPAAPAAQPAAPVQPAAQPAEVKVAEPASQVAVAAVAPPAN